MINKQLDKRQKIDRIFKTAANIVTWSSLVILAILLYHVSITGINMLSFEFLDNFPSRFPHKAGTVSYTHLTLPTNREV